MSDDVIVKAEDTAKEWEIYKTLATIDFSKDKYEKNNLTYLPWMAAYDETARRFPIKYEFLKDVKHHTKVIETITTRSNEDGSTTDYKTTETVSYDEVLPYFNTPVGLEVRTRVEINGISKEMELPVYSFKNKSQKLDEVDMGGVYKSLMRCLAKNIAMFGTGSYIYRREDTPKNSVELQTLWAEIGNLFKERAALSEATKEKCNEVLRDNLPAELNCDYRLCEDVEVLKKIRTRLRAIRKIPDKKTDTAKK